MFQINLLPMELYSIIFCYFRKWNNHFNKCQRNKKKPSLLKVLAATFWPEYTFLGFTVLVQEIFLRLYLPIALGDLLDYFRKDSTTTRNQALWYASIVVVVNACCAVLINQYIVNAFHYGMRVRAACCALIYRKVSRLGKLVALNLRMLFQNQTLGELLEI